MCINDVLGTFSRLYTSETRLYRKKMNFSGKSNQSRWTTTISPTRTPNLIKIPSEETTQRYLYIQSAFLRHVRPILERDSSAWSPYYKMDILKVERPQRRFTKMLPGMKEYSYLRRLKMLGEETLLVRRIKLQRHICRDEYFRICNNLEEVRT